MRKPLVAAIAVGLSLVACKTTTALNSKGQRVQTTTVEPGPKCKKLGIVRVVEEGESGRNAACNEAGEQGATHIQFGGNMLAVTYKCE
jgi:hypothetical protein